MPFRSRRSSQENILENDSGKTSSNNGTRGGLIPEIVMEGDRLEGEELSYWLRVSVSTSQLEREVAAHPGVGEAVVRGVHVPAQGLCHTQARILYTWGRVGKLVQFQA